MFPSSKEVRSRVDSIVDDYLAQGDASNENANLGFGPNGLLFAISADGAGRDYLARLEAAGHRELAALHKAGAVHIHDLGLGFPAPYCSGWSLPNLLDEGIKGGFVESEPAKHFRSAINHLVNFIGAASNEFAGAQAVNDIDLYLAPYAFKSFLDYRVSGCPETVAYKLARREVYQSIQELLFHLNYNNRWGGQSPFSNITLAITCPKDMRDRVALVGGKPLADYYDQVTQGVEIPSLLTYGELGNWQELVLNAILDTFMAGDRRGNGFTFPVLTINATPEFFEHKVRHKVFALAAKYGTPYFQNFVNGRSGGGHRINPEDVRSMCCRLSIDESMVRKHVGGLFGNAEQTGSLQVVTLSLPYLAQEALDVSLAKGHGPNVGEFTDRLGEVMDLAKEEMLWKRQVVDYYLERGLFPMAKSNLKRGFVTYFTTIGFVGLWEAVAILTNDDRSFLTPEGMAIAKSILHFMLERVNGYTAETGKLFNLEATPAESASYKLAKKALRNLPQIRHQGTKRAPYFTNSCHLPAELQDRLDLVFATQSELQTIPNGGTVTHFYTGEAMTAEQVETFVKTVCETPLPFFSVTPVFSVCIKHGHIPGAHVYCPLCTEADAKEIQATRPDLVEG